MPPPKVKTEDLVNLVTVSQAAKLMKIGNKAIHQAIQRGRLKAIKLGGVLFINRLDLPKYKKGKSIGEDRKRKSNNTCLFYKH